MKRAKHFVVPALLAALGGWFGALPARAQGLVLTLAGNGPAGFCGDGARAANSCLQLPVGITSDSAGNRYIADSSNHRVRKVTPGGIISTFAGNGIAGFSGDGGPAVRASFRFPTSVAFETATGNIYILDAGNNRIRRVTPTGIVTTVAGDGTAGFSGDGGPATAASISTARFAAGITWTLAGLLLTDTGNGRIRRIDPAGRITTIAGAGMSGFRGDGGPAAVALLSEPTGPIAVDPAGNLFFADSGNHRVRRITAAGIISTVAGSGTAGFSGDGGAALSAALNNPLSVALDRLGALYIADTGNSRIRRAPATGVITTIAGGGRLATGEGALSTDLTLREPVGVATDRNTLFIADRGNSRVLMVLGAFARPAEVGVKPAAVEFAVKRGADLPDVEGLVLFSPDLIRFAYGARVSTVSGGDWLSLRPPFGFVPGAIRVFADPTGLAAGTYQGTITLTVPQATNSPLSLPVTLKVTDEPPSLAVHPGQLSFSAVQGSNPPDQVLRIRNEGGGTLGWTAVVLRPVTGTRLTDWLSLSANAGTGSGSIRVTVNTTGLAPGSYQSAIVVRSTTGQTQRVPVNLQVTASGAVLQTSQSGLIFVAVEGSGTLPSRNFNVVNAGGGAMNWTAEIRSISGGSWLALSPASGASTGGQAPPQVVFTANATGLKAGAYHAVVRIAAPGAANSPQFVNAVLNILPPGTTPPPQPSPSGLLFLANAGGAPPAAQTVRVFAGGSATVSFNASIAEVDDDGWLSADPESGTGSAAAATEVSVAVDPSALAAGSYRGLVNFSLSDGSTRSVNVLVVVAPPGTFPASADTPDDNFTASVSETSRASSRMHPAATAPCSPTKLAVVHTALVSNFSSPVGWPIPLVVSVTDDCGNAQTNAAVVTTFSNGDPAVAMANLKNGQYSGTWTPTASASRVNITSTAVAAGFQQATAQITGGVGANAVPLVFRGGAVHAASFAKGAPLVPGSIVSVFGSNLAAGQFFAETVPLPKELGSLSATMGNTDVPLFFSSSGQVNAQVPFDLPAHSATQLVVKVGNSFTVPETINLAASQPGVFTINQSGSGPGAILDAKFVLVSAQNPAKPGDVIQVFATGLGQTNPVARSGERSPSSPPATVVKTVTATVDGINAPVHFAGLAPGFVGLYQVNVQIPAGVKNGEVSLVLKQEDVESNTVTVFVQQ